MGNFYTNFAVRGAEQDAVLAVLKVGKRTAVVTPKVQGYTVVYDEACDAQDESEIDEVGSLLSRELQCPVLASLVHDDDILWLGLYEAGELTAAYDSSGNTADITRISRTLGSFLAIPVIWIVMNLPHVIFESMRHWAFARLVGLPACSVYSGYRYVVEEFLPPFGVMREQLASTHELPPPPERAEMPAELREALQPTFRNRARAIVNLLWLPVSFLLMGFSLPLQFPMSQLPLRMGMSILNFALLIWVTISVRDQYGVPRAIGAYLLTNMALGAMWIVFVIILGITAIQDFNRDE